MIAAIAVLLVVTGALLLAVGVRRPATSCLVAALIFWAADPVLSSAAATATRGLAELLPGVLAVVGVIAAVALVGALAAGNGVSKKKRIDRE